MNINIYCDESCHLENDGVSVGVIGAVWCPASETRRIFERIREIQVEHGLPKDFEIKWNKVSPAKIDFYLALIDYFFKEYSLHYRAIIAPDKSKLRHDDFGQTHDDWYYKMYYGMLKQIILEDSTYRIYLDYKDTRGGKKVATLWNALTHKFGDYSSSIFERIQIVHSHEVELIQLADLLTGAVSYANRDIRTSPAKLKLVGEIKRLTGYSLTNSTILAEKKFNLLAWRATEAEDNVLS